MENIDPTALNPACTVQAPGPSVDEAAFRQLVQGCHLLHRPADAPTNTSLINTLKFPPDATIWQPPADLTEALDAIPTPAFEAILRWEQHTLDTHAQLWILPHLTTQWIHHWIFHSFRGFEQWDDARLQNLRRVYANLANSLKQVATVQWRRNSTSPGPMHPPPDPNPRPQQMARTSTPDTLTPSQAMHPPINQEAITGVVTPLSRVSQLPDNIVRPLQDNELEQIANDFLATDGSTQNTETLDTAADLFEAAADAAILEASQRNSATPQDSNSLATQTTPAKIWHSAGSKKRAVPELLDVGMLQDIGGFSAKEALSWLALFAVGKQAKEHPEIVNLVDDSNCIRESGKAIIPKSSALPLGIHLDLGSAKTEMRGGQIVLVHENPKYTFMRAQTFKANDPGTVYHVLRTGSIFLRDKDGGNSMIYIDHLLWHMIQSPKTYLPLAKTEDTAAKYMRSALQDPGRLRWLVGCTFSVLVAHTFGEAIIRNLNPVIKFPFAPFEKEFVPGAQWDHLNKLTAQGNEIREFAPASKLDFVSRSTDSVSIDQITDSILNGDMDSPNTFTIPDFQTATPSISASQRAALNNFRDNLRRGQTNSNTTTPVTRHGPLRGQRSTSRNQD